MSQVSKGYVIAIVGILVWSTTGIFISHLITTYALPALLLSFWRNVLVCVALAPALFIIHRSLLRLERAHLRFVAAYGLLLAVFSSTWTLSVQSNGAAVGTVLAYSSAGFTAIFSWWLYKERFGLPKLIAIVLSLIGCVLVANAYDPAVWNVNPLGIITGLLSGVLFAAYNIMGKEAAKRNLNSWTALLYSFAFGTLFMFIFNLFPFLPGTAGSLPAIIPNLPPDGWLILVILSFFPTLLGFGLYNTSMNYLSASTASLIATSEPAMTTVEAYILLDERMSVVQVVGSLIILCAVLMVRFIKEPAARD